MHTLITNGCLISGLLLVLYIGWFAWMVKHAPYGHEDDDGFHYD